MKMSKCSNCKIVNMTLLVAAMLLWIAAMAPAQVTKYTDEAAFLDALSTRGYTMLREGFENDAVWGSVRSSLQGTNSAPNISSMGITWTSNHPVTNDITTSSGAAKTGNWGIYDPDHGVATGTLGQCNLETPPPECFFHDGITGAKEPGGGLLYAVGGWIRTSSPPARISFVLDGITVKDFETIQLGTAFLFFGVIDTRGFNSFEIRETEGAVGDEKFIFADDFTFGTGLLPDNTPPVASDDGYVTNEGAELSWPAPGVLGNDTDADGNALTASLNVGPSNGILTLNTDGSFTYTANTNFTGEDKFRYHANDGTDDSNIVTVTITVDPLNDPPVENGALPAINLLLLN